MEGEGGKPADLMDEDAAGRGDDGPTGPRSRERGMDAHAEKTGRHEADHLTGATACQPLLTLLTVL